MPTYEYRCTDCGRDLEVVQKFSDASLTVCPTCSGTLRKVFNAVGVVFKGSGFYRTDSRAATGNGSGESGGSAEKKSDTGDKGGEKSSESKPATADAAKSETKTKTESSKPDKASSNGSGPTSSTGSKAAAS